MIWISWVLDSKIESGSEKYHNILNLMNHVRDNNI